MKSAYRWAKQHGIKFMFNNKKPSELMYYYPSYKKAGFEILFNPAMKVVHTAAAREVILRETVAPPTTKLLESTIVTLVYIL